MAFMMTEEEKAAVEKFEEEYDELFLVRCSYLNIKTEEKLEGQWFLYHSMDDIKNFFSILKWFHSESKNWKLITDEKEKLVYSYTAVGYGIPEVDIQETLTVRKVA